MPTDPQFIDFLPILRTFFLIETPKNEKKK